MTLEEFYNTTDQHDRWEIDGDCRLCRRWKHCNKFCKIHKEKMAIALEELRKENSTKS